MRFKDLDLNLLVCLDVLLEVQNVTRASERLNLSQPAVSAALARLRAYFDDPLLVHGGKRMMPTPHALRLQPAIKAILQDVDALVGRSPKFDPATSTRLFRISTSDFVTSVLLAPLLARLEISAPGVQFDLSPVGEDAIERLDRGEIDLLLTPETYVSNDHPAKLLFEEEHVVAGWSGNPLMDHAISLEAFKSAGHVAVEIGRSSRVSFAESNMRAQGIERRVELRVASFTLLPQVLIASGRLAVMHRRLAELAARHYPIVFGPLPFAVPAMREMVQFHRARAEDAGIVWLINALQDAATHPSYL